MFEVEVRNVAGEPAAVGSAGPHTLVVDRPADGGRLTRDAAYLDLEHRLPHGSCHGAARGP